MAEYRTIRMSFWNDPYIEDLCAEEKLLYLYLFTSPHTNNLGILEITRRKMAFESGLPQDAVEKGLRRLETDGKIVLDANMVWLANFIKNQTSTSKKLIDGLRTLFAATASEKIRRSLSVRYPALFGASDTPPDGMQTVSEGIDTLSEPSQYPTNTPGNGMQTVSIPSGEKEEEREVELKTPPNNDLGLKQDARVAQTVPEGGGIAEPGLEFLELRQAYDQEGRKEAPLAGFEVYMALKKSRQWPGLGQIYHALESLARNDEQWRAGKAPGLAKFLREQWWRMEPRSRSSPPAAASASSLAERNLRTVQEVLESESGGADAGH